ncbi:MAG: sulfate ABC transporter substrate-binding protein [Anaerolineales bacterium]|nr:sulfate ABC transporter substrate-binding protein [Anaerolineales bacterium]
MKTKTLVLVLVVIMMVLVGAISACSANLESDAAGADTVTLTLGAYTTPREAYSEIIPLFQAYWKEKTGQEVVFEESYLGSGAQSRAVVEGFEADVVALSLEADVTRMVDAGLITRDWHAAPNKGIVSTSVVVFAVRSGNPKDIQDWDDLAAPGVEILTPNPKTSGGAQWNILALYGAAKRGYIEGVAADDDAAAQAFLAQVLANVTVMDKAARDSITNFEKGVGDLAITYENEVLVAQLSGQDYDMVIPRSTILIENPVAVVDAYAEKHGTQEVADAFVEFLFAEEAQRIYAKYGLRSVDADVAADTAELYPPVEDLFTIDYFGGWAKATPDFFSDEGIFSQVLVDVQGSGD